MGIKKEHVFSVALVLVFGLAIFLPDMIFKMIPSESVQRVVSGVVLGVLILFLAYGTYQDAAKNQFTTTKYIVFADCMQIAALIVAGIPCFYHKAVADMDGLLFWGQVQAGNMIALLVIMLLQSYLKSQKFRRE